MKRLPRQIALPASFAWLAGALLAWLVQAPTLAAQPAVPDQAVHTPPDTAVSARQSAALQAWVKQHAIPLRTVERDDGDDADLRAAVRAIIRPETRVIGFGEAVHGMREILALRNRLFAYLVEHYGVTAYASETSFSGATRIDDYITRGGELTEDIWSAAYVSVPGGERRRSAARCEPSARRMDAGLQPEAHDPPCRPLLWNRYLSQA